MTSAYGKTGVRTTEELSDFPRMLDVLRGTFAHRAGRIGAQKLGFGHYANVLDLGNNLGLAVSTDGVGTKIIVADLLAKYDTIGIDCVAMNVNDIVCVGAEPIAMTDYIAVEQEDGDVLSQVAVGLARGARLAHITIPGGEIAQVREMVRGIDVAGACVGTVPMDRIITGTRIDPGDAVIGYASTGLHSNGYTLARQVLLGEKTSRLQERVPELGRTLGEELLEPTAIYVDLAMSLLAAVDVRGLAHITSDGFLNLARMEAPVGYEIETLPQAPPIFDLIAREGTIAPADMYLVYNMGVGFCAIVPEADAADAIALGAEAGFAATRIGTATDDPDRSVRIVPAQLRSLGGHFEPY
ncbi:MAG: phosphoribosylformylglycinamidine cyclo-ligase [Chloroflexi bacterium]|nr:phosphoribosylformylglycinamidine cyclo-ligase [Chloroflexota bacterium]